MCWRSHWGGLGLPDYRTWTSPCGAGAEIVRIRVHKEQGVRTECQTIRSAYSGQSVASLSTSLATLYGHQLSLADIESGFLLNLPFMMVVQA